MNTTKTRLALILALALGGTATAGATTISLYDNLGLGDFSQAVNGGGWIANEFSTGTDCPTGCKLEKVTLVLNTTDDLGLNDTSNLRLEITTDGGSVPGAVTISTLNNPSSIDSGGALAMFTPQLDTMLDDDTEYWVKLSSLLDPLSPGEVSWEYTFSGSGGWAFADPAFGELSGNEGPFLMSVEASLPQATVPAPTALWLMVPMLAGFAVRAQTKRK